MNIFLTILTLAYAVPDAVKIETFDTKIIITSSAYFLDNSSEGKPYKCDAYGNKKAEGIKVKFKRDKGITYALECEGHEVGTSNNLLVFKEKKKVDAINSIAYAGGDCDYSGSTQSWIEDINSDEFLDVIKRGVSTKTDSGCTGAGTSEVYEYSDTVKVYLWNKTASKFIEKKLDKSSIESYKEKYKIN